jgi:glyoxylase-like metal-dependent hydrolase (beta-lactamase superfamily II)
MFQVSRRDLVLSSVGAGLAFGLKGPVSFIGAANAQRAADSLKYKVGDIEVFSLHDGNTERTIDAAWVKNAALDDVKAALTKAGMGPDKIANPFTPTAARVGNRVILFDVGFGANGAPTVGKLHDNMKAAGLDPAGVTDVVISHFHGDHISGLWAKETSEQIYPKAEIWMPEVEYKHFTDPALIEKAPEAQRGILRRIQSTFPTWKNVKQFNSGADIAPGIKAVATPGHTVGHMAFHVSSGGQQLFIQGDVAGVPAVFVKNPDWASMFDADGPKAAETRKTLYDRIVAEKAMVAGYHFYFPNVGTLSKDGSGYAFEPVKA